MNLLDASCSTRMAGKNKDSRFDGHQKSLRVQNRIKIGTVTPPPKSSFSESKKCEDPRYNATWVCLEGLIKMEGVQESTALERSTFWTHEAFAGKRMKDGHLPMWWRDAECKWMENWHSKTRLQNKKRCTVASLHYNGTPVLSLWLLRKLASRLTIVLFWR